MKTIFGGLISIVLLGIYLHLVRVAVKVVYCVKETGCTRYIDGFFNSGMAQALSVIGGLVSALVIAELAMAKAGKAPALRALPENASPLVVKTVTIVSTFYVLAWIGAGLTAFLVGLYHPDKVPPLTTLGQAWLGLAVSAAYSYFGLSPENRARD